MGRLSAFTPAEKRDAVLAVLSKQKTISEVCRDKGISAPTFARWREQALEGMAEALADKADRNSREAELERRLAEAERTVGRLALENELLGKASRRLT
ncbi:transposase [Rhabdothermincola sediminis]|uniref:transposase n=1 Tax=Rhabdothermincola sediminis TaxID=2751370 RepID=UPI001AA07DE2|nr:transposase [Rhabdothermincola sediminis]